MKKALGAVFGVALLVVPGLMIAQRYETPFVSCVAQYPTVSLGSAGRFHAVSNAPGPFMWVADSEDYGVYDAGNQFVTPFTKLGLQEVTVVWGSKRSSCFVSVVAAPGFGEPYAPLGGIMGDYPPAFAQGYGPNVTLSSTLYPSMPNTGFAPENFAALAFAFVLLVAAGIALRPHLRYAIAATLR